MVKVDNSPTLASLFWSQRLLSRYQGNYVVIMENNIIKTYLGDNLRKGPYMTFFSEMKISHEKANVFSSRVKNKY